MLNPVAMSIVTNTFTDPAERARAIGIWGAVFGISMALGPVVGRRAGRLGRLARDLLGQHPGRHRRDHPHRAVRARVAGAPGAPRLDPVGQVLVIVLLASLTYAIIEGPSCGLDLAAGSSAASGWPPWRCSA